MGKKFDVVIGNPPYQEEAQGDATHAMPIYDKFMDAAYEVAEKAVLITPARFLFNAGYTPKAWNQKMLNDRHLRVAHYVPNSDELFPGTDIKGGIAVTYWDRSRDDEPIDTFSSFAELNSVLHKVNSDHGGSLGSVITSSRSYAYTDRMHADHPEAAGSMAKGEQYKVNTRTFELLPFLYSDTPPDGTHAYVRVLGLIKNRRFTRWIRKDYITGPTSFDKFKVALPAANGSGTLGEVLSSPLVVEPGVAVTQTFITIGAFDDEADAQACLKYVKTKFARAMLGILKITQHNPAKVWKHVPLQDFTEASDIDWSKSIPEIDQQLYAKYGLDQAEIDFIESRVKPMS